MRDEIKEQVDARTAKLLEKREARITAIKVLRKFTEFSKDNFEDILKGNFDLKKQLIESDTQNKILKVTLARVKAAQAHKKPVVQPVTVQTAANPSLTSTTSWKKPKSLASSTASTSVGDSESIRMEFLKAKKEWTEKEQNYKVQLGRMKVFYDKHLGELNHLKQTIAKKPPTPMKKTAAVPAATTIPTSAAGTQPVLQAQTTTPTVTAEQQKEQVLEKPTCCQLHPHPSAPTAAEETIRSLRNKLLHSEEHKKTLDSKIAELQDQVAVLRGRVQGQGVVKMRAVAEQLKGELAKAQETIKAREQRILEIDSLDYQLKTKYPEDGYLLTKIANAYLKLRASMRREPEEIWQDTVAWFWQWVDGACISPTARILHALLIVIRDKVVIKGIDQQAILEAQVKEWMSRPEMGAQSLKDLRFQLTGLQEQVEALQKQNDEYRIKLQAVSSMGHESQLVTQDSKVFEEYVVDVKRLQKELEQEEAMPDHLKKRVAVWNDQWFSTRIRLTQTQTDLKTAKQTIKSLESQLSVLAATLQKKSSKKLESVPSNLMKPTSSSSNRGAVIIKTVRPPSAGLNRAK